MFPQIPPWEGPNDSSKIRREIIGLIGRYRDGDHDAAKELADAIALFAYEGGSDSVLYQGVVYQVQVAIDDGPGSDPGVWRLSTVQLDQVVDLSAPTHTMN